jgi:asparagine synthetase B (glutamine-hydrolysing)
MYGICGEADLHRSHVKIEPMNRMCDVLAHRGPDDKGMAGGVRERLGKRGRLFVQKYYSIESIADRYIQL